MFTEPELHRRRADGSPIVVSVSTSPLRRPDGTIYGIMSILMDVTERKAAEETRARLTVVPPPLPYSPLHITYTTFILLRIFKARIRGFYRI